MEAIAPAVYGPMPGIRRKASMEEGMEPLCSDITSASLGGELTQPNEACNSPRKLQHTPRAHPSGNPPSPL